MDNDINIPKFEEPLGFMNSDGDVVIPGGEPKPQPQDWARADLERDHPMTTSLQLENVTDTVDLAESNAALQHRISRDNRIRGLGHIAAIKDSINQKKSKNDTE